VAILAKQRTLTIVLVLVLLNFVMLISHLKLAKLREREQERELWLDTNNVIGWMVRTETPYYEFVPRAK
jgi:hypothetical protein